MFDLFRYLKKPSSYEYALSRLQKRLRNARFVSQKSSPEKQYFPQWIIENDRYVIGEVIRSLKGREYQPGNKKRTILRKRGEKERTLYISEWIDRLVEMTIAQLITEQIEEGLPESLYSFRKGRGSNHAVAQFADYIRVGFRDGTPSFIAKQDVAKYGDSIQISRIPELIEGAVGKQDEYLLSLITDFLRFPNSEVGIVSGSPLTPVVENMYLVSLDRALESSFSGRYLRYGDDIIVASTSRSELLDARSEISKKLGEVGLRAHSEKSVSVFLSNRAVPDQEFHSTPSVEYLGVKVSFDGTVFLSAGKLKRLKKHIRAVTKRAQIWSRRLGASKDEQIHSAIQSVNVLLEEAHLIPFFQILSLPNIDEKALSDLDRWVAKQCISEVFGSSHDRVFRNCSYQELRRRGLFSLTTCRHRRVRNSKARIGKRDARIAA